MATRPLFVWNRMQSSTRETGTESVETFVPFQADVDAIYPSIVKP